MRRRRATEGLIEQLKTTIAAKLREASVPVVEIDGRIKRLWSIHQKLKAQRIELDQVYDFIALRVITTSVKDCYAALGIIHQTWSPVPGRIKDFIAMPRPNGYQSLHTSVISDRGMPFELQIRTMEMHRMAEEGIAAHWKYKEGRVGDHKDERYFQWMRQLLEYQQEVRDPQEFIQHLKVDLYAEEVYTFTPKGQVKAFPRGATPIDFAYSIHTDVGHQCVGARVNGKMVPLRAHLRNGDIVEIMTSAGHKPSRDWLNFVVTSHARYKIKHLIRLEERTRAIDLGRKVFEKEARKYDVSPKGIQETRGLHQGAGRGRREDARGSLRADRLRHAIGEAAAWPARAGGSAAREAAGRHGQRRRPARVRRRRGEDQGHRRRRCAGVPGAVLQSDSRREDRRVHHARQGRLGPFRDLLQRPQSALRSGAPHRRRMGQERQRRVRR